ACDEVLPALQFIDAKVALANEVHVSQLLRMYRGEKANTVYDPLALQKLADGLLSLSLTAGKQVDQTVVETYNSLCESLKAARVGLRTEGKLEALLFWDVLGIRPESLQQIEELGAENRGYVERLVAEINHRIDERLDIS